MRAADLDLIFVPEGGDTDPDHWQTRWRARLSTAQLVGSRDDGEVDAESVVRAASRARRPIYFIAHSTGAIAVVQAAARLNGLDIRGAFLVAPPAQRTLDTLDGGRWGETPRAKLPFASQLVASRTDPWASLLDSRALAADWGSELIDAGEAGRLDADSGHGPWPDGLLRLANVFKRL